MAWSSKALAGISQQLRSAALASARSRITHTASMGGTAVAGGRCSTKGRTRINSSSERRTCLHAGTAAAKARHASASKQGCTKQHCLPAKVRVSLSGMTTVSCSNIGRWRRAAADDAASSTSAAHRLLPAPSADSGTPGRSLLAMLPLLLAPSLSGEPGCAAARVALGSPSCSSSLAGGRARLRRCRNAIPRAPGAR